MKTDKSRTRRAAPLPKRRAKRAKTPFGPRAISALSKNELVALATKLQADIAAASVPAPAPPSPPQAEKAKTLVIDGCVRSGQTISFPEGDVIVVGSVGSGAEIIAGGSIHVYGALRGRAIAGAAGDGTARIFCQDLDAELLSIDGHYRVAENFDGALRGRPVQARLDGLRMALSPLDGGLEPHAVPTAEPVVPMDRFRRAGKRVKQLIRLNHAPVAEASA